MILEVVKTLKFRSLGIVPQGTRFDSEKSPIPKEILSEFKAKSGFITQIEDTSPKPPPHTEQVAVEIEEPSPAPQPEQPPVPITEEEQKPDPKPKAKAKLKRELRR